MAHARFETFMPIPEELAERRRRLMMGALAAAALSMAMGLSSWTADKLGITRVAPPKHTYAVTLQVLEPPPPPSPPPMPAAAAQTPTSPAAPEEPVPPALEPPVEAVEPLDLEARPSARVPVPGSGRGGGGDPRGSITGIPGPGARCLLPPCFGAQSVIGQPMVPLPRSPASAPEKAPLAAVMASSVFTPNPDPARLSRTATGRSHRSPGKTTVAFCIDGNGKTYDVRVRRGFPGDAEVDEICRTTVAKWRFSPQRVGGKARSTCTSVTFDIRFE